MKRISRLAAAVISTILLFSFTTAAVTADENISVSDIRNYVTRSLN